MDCIFTHGERVQCPDCHKDLEVSETDYSGCGVDMGNCPRCGKGYEISFRVDTVKREPSWDVPIKQDDDALLTALSERKEI